MIINYIILAVTVVLAVFANLIVKKGSFAVENITLTFSGIFDLVLAMLRNIYILGGLAGLGISFVLWTWLLSRMQLNVMYPISVGAQVVFLSVVSWLIFRESLSAIQVGGIVLIIFGIFLLLKPV